MIKLIGLRIDKTKKLKYLMLIKNKIKINRSNKA